MKRLVLALFTLTLLLAATPPASASHQSEALCNGTDFPETFLNLYIDSVIGESFEGSLCLKGCKSEFQGCKKTATLRKKCQVAVAKAFYTTEALTCQLNGGNKKVCTTASKTDLADEKAQWKGEFLFNKDICEKRYAVCKTECNN
jgi:hypothetical protein